MGYNVHMKTPTVIYILGLPASGKSTLAKKLSVELNVPLISKDDLKVMLFDAYGWTNREGSMQAGRASYDIIDYLLDEQLRVGNAVIIESTPPKFASEKFKMWRKKYDARFIQIYCEAEADVIRKRFKERILADDRHVSSVEGEAGLQNVEVLIKQGFKPIDVESEIIRVDTSDFDAVDEAGLITKIRRSLAS